MNFEENLNSFSPLSPDPGKNSGLLSINACIFCPFELCNDNSSLGIINDENIDTSCGVRTRAPEGTRS